MKSSHKGKPRNKQEALLRIKELEDKIRKSVTPDNWMIPEPKKSN